MPPPSNPELAASLIVAAHALNGYRTVAIVAGACVAALLLVIGQLLAARRITRLERAIERPHADLDNRLRRIEGGWRATDPTHSARLGELEWLPAEIERLRRQLAGVSHRIEDLDPQGSEQAAPLALRVARLERLTHRLAQQVAVTRETTDYYADRRSGDDAPRSGVRAVYVDVFLISGAVLPALAQPAERDHLLVRRTEGAAPDWGSTSPWGSGNGNHPTPYDQDLLATFSATMVNRFFDPRWSRETTFWLAPAVRDVAELAQDAAASADAWLGLITGGGFDSGALRLAAASPEALTVVGRDLRFPGDSGSAGVRWLVQFCGELVHTQLSNACVKSLPYDLVAETLVETIRGVLDDALLPVGRREIAVSARPRNRAATLELEQLKADALRTAADRARSSSSSSSADGLGSAEG